jgi:Spy/CpxP family protein refolding chaperone
MKNTTLSLCVAAAALFTIPSTGFAQEKPAGAPPAHTPGAGRGARLNPEERLKQMAETLGLTQEQQDKIKAIFEKIAPAMKELMDKGFQNLTEEDRTKMRDLMKKQFEEIDALLTPEQKEKQKAEMEKRRGQGRPGGQPKPEPTK